MGANEFFTRSWGKDIGDAYQKGEWVFFGLAPC